MTFRLCAVPEEATIVYGDGNDAPLNTWGALNAQQQAESDASVTYKAPSIVSADAYRLDFVEADAFTGGNTRVYRTTMHPAMTFAAGPFSASALPACGAGRSAPASGCCPGRGRPC